MAASSAIAIKNTFLQVSRSSCGAVTFSSSLGQSTKPRPRGETFDASQLGPSRHLPYETKTASGDQPSELSFDDDASDEHAEGINTTIMLRNIPNKYTQKMLLEVIEDDFQGLFNFFYLPIDFKNKCNVGYAFLNFIEPYYCQIFWKKFSGRKLTGFKSKKVCRVSWGRVQGLRNNLEHYRNSSILNMACEHYKPMIFRRGQAVPFPSVKKTSGAAAAGAHEGSATTNSSENPTTTETANNN